MHYFMSAGSAMLRGMSWHGRLAHEVSYPAPIGGISADTSNRVSDLYRKNEGTLRSCLYRSSTTDARGVPQATGCKPVPLPMLAAVRQITGESPQPSGIRRFGWPPNRQIA